VSRVDFYLLKAPEVDQRLLAACRIVEKAWRKELRVLIRTTDDDEATRIDDWLWSFRDDAFVPHERWDAASSDNPGFTIAPVMIAPVIIASDPCDQIGCEVLVNLANTVPPFDALPERIVEVVGADADSKRLGREHYRHYRDRDCELLTHEL
jgi:DNA polymerase-3 subunit chi